MEIENRYDIINKHFENNDFIKGDFISFQNYRFKKERLENLMLLDTLNKLRKPIVSFVNSNFTTLNINCCYKDFIKYANDGVSNFFYRYGFDLSTEFIKTEFYPHFMPTIEDLKEPILNNIKEQINCINNNKKQLKIF